MTFHSYILEVPAQRFYSGLGAQASAQVSAQLVKLLAARPVLNSSYSEDWPE
jgi:hypothetical protein